MNYNMQDQTSEGSILLPKKPIWKVGDVIKFEHVEEIILAVTDFVYHLGAMDGGIVRVIGKATQDQLDLGGWKRVYSYSLDIDEISEKMRREIHSKTDDIRTKYEKIDLFEKSENIHDFMDICTDQPIATAGVCDTCGNTRVFIRPRVPEGVFRNVCPTCLADKIEQIYDISNSYYGRI